MQSGYLANRTVQVHPTLRCNLACLHCYSSSAPAHRKELDPETLTDRLALLRAEGFEILSFSGGEPLLYSGLERVARSAVAMGYRVNLVSNGLLLNEERVATLKPLVSAIGLSLDGPPDEHNRMRANPRAFAKLVEKMALLRQARLPFGLAHCVTRATIQHLPWLAEFARDQGAQLLQVHPLNPIGRAGEGFDDLALRPEDTLRIYLIAELLGVQMEGEIGIQLDLVPARHLLDNRSLHLPGNMTPETRLADAVNPVVMDEVGNLSPYCHGFAAEHRIASGGEDWSAAFARFKERGSRRLGDRLREVFTGLEARANEVVDWYALVNQRQPDDARSVVAGDLGGVAI